MSVNMKPIAGRASIEELTMIRDFIMLPHMLTMSDKSLQDIRRSSNILKRYFEKFIQLVMDRITKDLMKVRRELAQRGIKVFDDESVDGIIYHGYSCRGYQDRFGIMRETLRAEISFRLAKYSSEVLKNESSMEGRKC
ncbi:hypothetical protein [Cohnella luojiensis]|uniref:Uncharacterized protein n=1 Tax=Cohnella luojiensis TaxID=652876 RepID=A0A4Y8M5T6_9BACL|nr:hypothetical protein [Cohnella luojiensis]TFE30852.1 hypothetical protein E2980_03490 [Cohnella luojiensis]